MDYTNEPIMAYSGSLNQEQGQITFTPNQIVNPKNHNESWDKKGSFNREPIRLGNVTDQTILNKLKTGEDVVLQLVPKSQSGQNTKRDQ